MQHFDVAIIGLGPAGAALARQLAGNLSVIALDKKQQQGNAVGCWHPMRSGRLSVQVLRFRCR